MKVTPDNIFVGAKVKLNEEEFTVIKVNAKSFYCTTWSLSEFNEKFEKRLPGVTFTKFCKYENIVSRKYTEPFEIEENEFVRKNIASKNLSKKYKIDKFDKVAITEFIKDMKKKKRSFILSQISAVGGGFIRFIAENDGCYLISFNGDYVLCSFETDEFIKISTVYDYNYESIPWEQLSVFSNDVVELTA